MAYTTRTSWQGVLIITDQIKQNTNANTWTRGQCADRMFFSVCQVTSAAMKRKRAAAAANLNVAVDSSFEEMTCALLWKIELRHLQTPPTTMKLIF